jgi:GNAT superfamily N-acetyltransferase
MIDYLITDQYDYENIARLYEKANNKQLGYDIYEWIYQKNSAGRAIAIIAKVEDRFVGFMGLFPWLFVHGKRQINAIQPGHLIVDPEFQGQGIFTHLIDLMINFIDNNKYDFCFGFPNNKALHGWRKNKRLIWPSPMIGSLLLVAGGILPLMQSAPVDVMGSSITFGKGTCVKITHNIYENSLNSFLTASKEQDIAKAIHSELFVNWRFLGRPNFNYQMIQVSVNRKQVGYAIGRVEGIKLLLFDFGFDESFCRQFWRGVKKAAALFKTPFVSVVYSYPRKLISGFSLPTRTEQPWFIIPKTGHEEYLKSLEWFITYADTDYMH